MQCYTVQENEEGLRLQHFIHAKLERTLSLRQVKRYLDERRCRVDGVTERFAGRKVEPGMRVELWLAERTQHRLICIYEDSHLAAYDKPAGLCWDADEIPHQPVHRLDKETSGLLLVGKNSQSCRELENLFRDRRIFKRYLAVVHGSPSTAEGVVENYLGVVRHVAGQPLYGAVAAPHGKYACTRYEVICKKGGRSLIACAPETGRTHQVRVHLASLGCPIVGDGHYGPGMPTPPKLQRHLLHAHTLVLNHPITGKKLRLEAKPSRDFRL